MDYTQHYSTKKTPQTKPIPGKDMVKNSAGGYSFGLDKWKQLDRFLILGSEGGTYYVSEKTLTVENCKAVVACIQENGKRALSQIIEISDDGRAPKNDPAIFSLALACTFGDQETKNYAYAAIPQICRIGTHLFHFCQMIQNLRGWSRGLRRGVANFYLNKEVEQVAYQLIKYQSRDGWSHRDVLRLSHPATKNRKLNKLFKYAVGKDEDCSIELIEAFEKLKKCTDKNVKKAVKLINDFKLPRECVPTELLNERDIWEALLPSMPMNAMIRNLGKMSAVGLLDSNFSLFTQHVCKQLTDLGQLKRGRIHPLNVLVALNTYSRGHGMKGSLSWKPASKISEALNESFYLSFDAVEPTNKNWLLGLDVSGSMSSEISNMPISCRKASAALAMVTVRTEPNVETVAFSDGLLTLGLHKNHSLEQLCQTTERLPFSATDCSLPILYAIKRQLPIDVFAIYTDSETYAGNIHPKQALDQYRQKLGRDAKMIVLGMTSNGFTIADPTDEGMLDVVGFDTSVPQVMSQFVTS